MRRHRLAGGPGPRVVALRGRPVSHVCPGASASQGRAACQVWDSPGGGGPEEPGPPTRPQLLLAGARPWAPSLCVDGFTCGHSALLWFVWDLNKTTL